MGYFHDLGSCLTRWQEAKSNIKDELMTSTSEKPEETHLEGTGADVDDIIKVDGYDSYGLVKSRYDELSIPQTLWVFKRVVLVSLAVYTGYVCEGFEVSETPPLPFISVGWWAYTV
jgi:hypothetical protein